MSEYDQKEKQVLQYLADAGYGNENASGLITSILREFRDAKKGESGKAYHGFGYTYNTRDVGISFAERREDKR
jgi:hypothetical protein